jgi:hypothetical protein
MAAAPKRVAGISDNAPPKEPMGVRTAATITADFINDKKGRKDTHKPTLTKYFFKIHF